MSLRRLLLLSLLSLTSSDFVFHAALTSFAPLDSDSVKSTPMTTEVYPDTDDMRVKISSSCDQNMVEAFDKFNSINHRMMVFVVCVLEVEGGAFIDPSKALIVKEPTFDDFRAVRSRSRRGWVVNPLYVTAKEPNDEVLKSMTGYLIEMSTEAGLSELRREPLLLAKKLYELMSEKDAKWTVIEEECEFRGRRKWNCRAGDGLITSQQRYPDPPPSPAKAGSSRVVVTMNVEEMDDANGHVSCPTPTHECLECLFDWEKSGCSSCLEFCGCYCESVCVDTEKKVRGEVLSVTDDEAQYQIPKIIHQTYFEDIGGENSHKYKQMERLQRSWQGLAGFEYKFYDDKDSRRFIEEHYPAAFVKAYDMMKVGAYKADFFRYCVLTIEGGIYADMDVMLQSDIELLLEPHLTFFAPVDSPGEKIGRQPCLWNGLMGATRAHPIVVRALEQAVTGILSRSTIVDIERDRLCPGVKDLTSLTRHYDTLFLSGPCNLGVAANEVIGTGREALSGFEAGLSELKLENSEGEEHIMLLLDMKSYYLGGALRIIDPIDDAIIAATNLKDMNDDGVFTGSDRSKAKEGSGHYSLTEGKAANLWGTEGVYFTEEEMGKINNG
ncbi:hypothetical protein TrST_g689 [Triparma strigata]|uniref:Glycosyltransferase family 32 protein n=1 Tax=Triparma strigata TaxID=1606541 RepID=A0A9W7ENH8_9STRA|nr:hypothetical protein TrST_g689 [Triparma strigata]